MRFFRNFSIGRKLTAITMLTSGVALLFACTAFAINEYLAARRTMVRDFATFADIFDENVASGLAFNDAASIQQALDTLNEDPRILAAAVFDKAGSIVASYQRAGLRGGFVFPAAQSTAQALGVDRLDTFKNIELAGEVIGVVYIGTSLSELRERIWRYSAIGVLLLVGSSLVALVLASRLQRIISRPIEDLARTVARVAVEKDYAIRAHKESDDELGRLVDGFNEMLVQIQARDSALESARGGLEQRVEERTAELAQQNEMRKRVEAELRAKTALLEAQQDSSIDGILVVNNEGKKIYQNQRVLDLWKIPPEISGEENDEKQVQYVMNRTKEPEQFAARVHYLYAHPTESSRDEIGFKDGMVLDRYSAPVVGKDGKQYGRIWGFRDITERRKAEEAMRESEERFSGAFEHAPIGVALVTPEGRWLKVNRALCELVGYSEAELLTRTFQDITYPADLAGDLTEMHRLIAGEIHAYQIEKRYVHSGGRLVPVLLNVSLVRDDQARPRYFISQIQDISARKLAETRLAESHRQLLDASRQAGMAEVATGVLHNVGNVLNSVNVSATLVADQVRHTKASNIAKLATLFDEHKPDLAGFLASPRGQMLPAYLGTLAESVATEQLELTTELEHLRQNIEHIKDIISAQQAYARTSGVTETVSVPDMIEDALRITAEALAQRGVQVVRDCQTRPVVTTDRHQVMQILINLVRNAKFACVEAGRPDKQIVVRTTSDDRRVTIAVSDNGIGIPAENLTRIFSHGFTTRQGGHGFGLHSCALAAKQLGGSLHVKSEGRGRGATFLLELPLKSVPPAHDNSVR